MILKKHIYTTYSFIAICLLLTSCKQVKLSDADKKFAEGEYFVAADLYKKVYKKTDTKNRELRGLIAHRMAESYRLSNNPFRASSAYANAVRYKVQDSTLNLQFARTLHKLGKYKEAAGQYQAFLELYPNNQYAINGLEGTKLASEWRKKPTDYVVKKMDIFGGRGGEFAPMLLPPEYDQVFFASNTKEALGDTISGVTGSRAYDIFMSRKDDDGKWMKPEHLKSPINTAGDEGAVSFSDGGTGMYYTSCPPDSLGNAIVSIYLSNRGGGEWGGGFKINMVKGDTTNVYAHPSISPDGNHLYFVSDIPLGYGGKDIWRATIERDSIVMFIENMGSDINTAGDEMFPYLRDNNTLYFSSDGHVGMGGLDIFKATLNPQNERWSVENMKYPINSFADDFGITFAGHKEEGFFSSGRGDARGYDHIYSFILPIIQTKVEGYIVDTDDEFVENANIRLVGKDGTYANIQGKENGTYSREVTRGIDYVMLASSEGYLNTRMLLKTVQVEKDSTYLVDFVLTPINKPVVLENVFFEFNKADLTPESRKELDELIALLEQNPNVTIELSAHTDRKGSDEYNNALSQRRAQSVVNYLEKGGINKERMQAVGKGKTDPKTVTKAVVKKYPLLELGTLLSEDFINGLSAEEQKMADQVNRRTEFKVLSVTYNLD